VYKLGDDYDPTNKIGAFQKAQEWDDKIPIGVLYRKERPTFEDQLPALKAGPLVRQKLDPAQVASILSEFM
jgi:2-oxoglutarate ferredoxin oxidoreductase subunit beta